MAWPPLGKALPKPLIFSDTKPTRQTKRSRGLACSFKILEKNAELHL
jgi:hypothetical protein